MTIFQILVLGLVQGACELLPVSSSATGSAITVCSRLSSCWRSRRSSDGRQGLTREYRAIARTTMLLTRVLRSRHALG
jgi:hypothetical protein